MGPYLILQNARLLQHDNRMAIKIAIEDIIGKTIKHVVVKESDSAPTAQVFLIFTDDTHYELYSSNGIIRGAGSVDPGGLEWVRAYLPEKKIVLER